ncbi:MFS transporter [Neokomagataea thailandica]|nr:MULTISPECIES: MFS transporter [Neokomagataea]
MAVAAGVQGIPSSSAETGLYGARRITAMSAVLLSLLLSVLDYAVANVALPAIAHDIHTPESSVIWVVNAYQLANLSCLLPLASLGARFGYARMSQCGIILFLIASVACALSKTLPEIALARALQGVGGACIMSVNLALVRFIYPKSELGRGISINGLFIGIGVAIGPTLGSIVLSMASWPWIFWINLPLALAALLMARFALPETPHSTAPVDMAGSLLTVLAFACIGIGLDGLSHGMLPMGGIVTLIGIVCWWQLLRLQKCRAEPIVPVDLLKRRAFLLPCLVSYMSFIASNLYIVAMPLTLNLMFHRDPATIGLLISPWAVGVALMSFVVGRFSDRFPASVLSTIGMVTVTIGFVLLWLLPADASNMDIIWRTLLAGCGFGTFQPPNNRAIMLSAPKGREGSASGMLSVARLGGQTTGALFVAGLFTASASPSSLCLAGAMSMAGAAALLSVMRDVLVGDKAS